MKILNFPQNSSDFGDSLYKGSAVEGLRRRQTMRWRAEEAAWCDRGETRLRRPGPRFSREDSPLPLRHWSFYCKRLVFRNICQVKKRRIVETRLSIFLSPWGRLQSTFSYGTLLAAWPATVLSHQRWLHIQSKRWVFNSLMRCSSGGVAVNWLEWWTYDGISGPR